MSTELKEEMARWTVWLANTSQPWAAYRATMASCLVAMDKMPGVRPLGFREIYCKLRANIVFRKMQPQLRPEIVSQGGSIKLLKMMKWFVRIIHALVYVYIQENQFKYIRNRLDMIAWSANVRTDLC